MSFEYYGQIGLSVLFKAFIFSLSKHAVVLSSVYTKKVEIFNKRSAIFYENNITPTCLIKTSTIVNF